MIPDDRPAPWDVCAAPLGDGGWFKGYHLARGSYYQAIIHDDARGMVGQLVITEYADGTIGARLESVRRERIK